MNAIGQFLRHSWCPHCPSSDGYAIYSTGSAYCFACGKYDEVAYRDDKTNRRTDIVAKKELINDVEYKQLKARKISRATCERYGYGIGITREGKIVQVAPYYRNNRLVGQHIRFPNKDFRWLGTNRGCNLFGQHLWPAGGKRLIITEGEIDCLSIAQAMNLKWPVVSIPNGAQNAEAALKQHIEYINSFDEVVLAFDNDEPGRNAIEACVNLIQPGKARILQYPGDCKDANDFLKAGRASELVSAVFNAQKYRPDGIIDGSEIYNEFMSDLGDGIDSPYPGLNEKLHNFRKGRLYLFTAGSGIGKSTLVKEIGYHFRMKHKQKLGVMALEESKRVTASNFVGIHLNKGLLHVSRRGTTPEELTQAFKEFFAEGQVLIYDHFGSVDLDNLLAKLRYMAVGFGVDWVILDHISIVVSALDDPANDERKLIDKLMTLLRSLIEETGIGVLAVVHLKRPPGQGKSWNEGRRVSLTDLRGSGGLEQISDVVISLERDQQGDNADVSIIRVLKNRDIGDTGIADTVKYNRETGRLLPTDDIFHSNQAVNPFKQENTDF